MDPNIHRREYLREWIRDPKLSTYSDRFHCPDSYSWGLSPVVTPKNVTRSMRSFWEMYGYRSGRKYKVPRFPGRARDIAEEFHGGRAALFIPRDLTLDGFLRVFPNPRSEWSFVHSATIIEPLPPITDHVDNHGWLWIDLSLDPPHKDATVEEATAIFRNQGREGQTLRTYVVAWVMLMFFHRWAFDSSRGAVGGIDRRSVLLGSSQDGDPVVACFGPFHKLGLRPYPKNSSGAYLPKPRDWGFRSEQKIE